LAAKKDTPFVVLAKNQAKKYIICNILSYKTFTKTPKEQWGLCQVNVGLSHFMELSPIVWFLFLLAQLNPGPTQLRKESI
jgi:hypothetical protein